MSVIKPLIGLFMLLYPHIPHGPAALPRDPGADEACFVQQTNATRAALGLSILPVSGSLAGEARAHTQAMASSNSLYHSTAEQYAGNWVGLGENVGVGPTCDDIERAFLASPHLRAAGIERLAGELADLVFQSGLLLCELARQSRQHLAVDRDAAALHTCQHRNQRRRPQLLRGTQHRSPPGIRLCRHPPGPRHRPRPRQARRPFRPRRRRPWRCRPRRRWPWRCRPRRCRPARRPDP